MAISEIKSQESTHDWANGFHAKNHKTLNLFADASYSLGMLTYHSLVSRCYKIANAAFFQQKHEQLAGYYTNRLVSRTFSWINASPNDIVNFSINTTEFPKISFEENNEKEEISKIYGSKFHTLLSTLKEKTPINEEKLSRLSMNSGGVCLGNSIDFIDRLSRGQRNGIPTQRLVEEISYLYTDHSTSEGEILEILANAIDTTEVNQKREARFQDITQRLDQYSKENERLIPLGFDLQESIRITEDEKIRKEKQEQLLNLQYKILGNRDKIIDLKKESLQVDAEFIQSFIQPLMEIHKTTLKLSEALGEQAFDSRNPSASFSEAIKNLPNGQHIIYAKMAKTTKEHAFVYVKESQSEGYFVDFSLSTFKMSSEESQISRLWDIIKGIYRPDRMYIYTCEPTE
ncbi:MAG: hypothetical protein Tsb0021_08150 [Chlamydiales bacterium]